MTEQKPNPGSSEARAQGCICPQIDNHYGKGFPRRGEQVWWQREDCPLHGRRRADDEEVTGI